MRKLQRIYKSKDPFASTNPKGVLPHESLRDWIQARELPEYERGAPPKKEDFRWHEIEANEEIQFNRTLADASSARVHFCVDAADCYIRAADCQQGNE